MQKARTESVGIHMNGYSLIQVAFALLILGIVTATFVQLYSNYRTQSDFVTTYNRVQTVTQRIQEYKQTTGVYPCPAGIALLRTAGNYGQASNCADKVTIANGACSADGICIRTTTRDVNPDAAVTTIQTIRVRVGAIPFRELQLEEKDTFDAYGSRLVYALTEDMGDLATFNDKKAGIDVVDLQGNQLTSQGGSASFFVLSQGTNRAGAFSSISGTQGSPCPAINLQPDDSWNCPAPNPNARFVTGYASAGATVNGYDDITEYFSAAEDKLWRRITPVSDIITDLSPMNVGVGQFAGGTADKPDDSLTIKQSTININNGVIQAPNTTGANLFNGALQTNDIFAQKGFCSYDGSKCYVLSDFGNAADDTLLNRCDPTVGEYPVGITSDTGADGLKHAAAICAPIRFKCPAGQVLRGIKPSSKEPDCGVAAPPCPAQSLPNPCSGGAPLNLPGPKDPGDVFSFPSSISSVSGSCATANYTCQNGNWVLTSGNYSAPYCTNGTITVNDCGAGYNGSNTYQACNPTAPPTSTCLCSSDYTYTVTNTCPNSSTSSSTCTQICSGGVLGPATCTPTIPCTCSNNDRFEFLDCPSPKNRKASPTPNDPYGGVIPWPANTLKGHYKYIEVDSATCGETIKTDDDSNCVCGGTTYIKTQQSPPNFCKIPKAGDRDVQDPMGTYPPELQNIPWDYTVTKASVNPDCSIGSSTPLADPDSNAKFDDDLTYRWATNSPPSTTATTSYPSSAFRLGGACTCSVYASTTFVENQVCYEDIGGGRYNIYRCGCRNY